MAGVNKVILVGNLGKDPEVRYLEGNIALAKFSLATSETIRDKSGNKTEQTEWHNIILWRGLAEIAEKYLRKGSTVYIEGKIRTRSYDDKEGNKKYITEITGENMTMLGNRKESQSEPTAASTHSAPDPMDNTLSGSGDDDLPF